MKSENLYQYPIDEDLIKNVSGDSPAHKKVTDNDGNIFDETRALDFFCDIGTPIKSALDGEVVDVKNSITKNYDGMEYPTEDEMPLDQQDGNFVVLKHENNEFTIYSHIKKDTITVKKGETVKAGDIIGHVGNSGWTVNPHLHFMVFRHTKPKPAKDYESLNVKWKK